MCPVERGVIGDRVEPEDAHLAGRPGGGSPRALSTVEVLPAPFGPRTTSTSPRSAVQVADRRRRAACPRGRSAR